MKKNLNSVYWFSGLLLVSCALFLINGCSQSTPTTTTTSTASTTSTSTTSTTTESTTTTEATTTTTTTSTTTSTISESAVQSAKAAGIIANGASYAGSSATTFSSGGTTASSIFSSSIRAMAAGGPPDAFFTTLPSDGYMQMTTEAVGGNVVPYFCMLIGGDIPVTPEVLVGKRIASFEGITLRDMFSSASSEARNAAIQAWVVRFQTEVSMEANPYRADSPLFTTFDSLGGYSGWSYVYSMSEQSPGWPAGCHLITPEVQTADKVASMVSRLVFQNDLSGEIQINIPCESLGDPKPAIGTYSGAGPITLPSGLGTVDAMASITFVAVGSMDVAPSTITISGSITPGNNYMYTSMDPIAQVGTGYISDEAGNQLGTFETTATGGIFYSGGTYESFTF
ncbi:MAG: hypothetical protein WC890_04090 [Candidatus Margulisiibacteriota bacterium]